MRAPLLLAVLALLSLAATAQEPQKTKTPAHHRTYIETIDMSSGAAAVHGFVEAFAAADYFKAYFLLSPEAKANFTRKVFEFNEAQYFPALDRPTGLSRPAVGGDDVIEEVYLDGAVMFDNTLTNVRNLGGLPFDFDQDAFISPTFEHQDQARYLVRAKGNPDVVVITAIRLSTGDWRVQRLVWGASDPAASPWGFTSP